MMWLINPEEVGSYNWGHNNALTKEGWSCLEQYIEKNPSSKAEIINSQVKESGFTEDEIRDTDITWISSETEETRELYFNIGKLIENANNQFFNYNISLIETLQHSVYNAPTGHYDWHIDAMHKGQHGLTRKISFSIGLNDPNEYEGGNLEFDFRDQVDWENNKTIATRECTEIRPRGSIVVFPSFMWHRVKPVLKGTRYSLVFWCVGHPWR